MSLITANSTGRTPTSRTPLSQPTSPSARVECEEREAAKRKKEAEERQAKASGDGADKTPEGEKAARQGAPINSNQLSQARIELDQP